MARSLMGFTPEVYAQIREGAQRSAAVLVPMLADLFAPKTVVDVGGGEGWWAQAFLQHGAERALVLDSSAAPVQLGPIEFAYFDAVAHAHWPLQETFDLALCLEVAEHVPEDTADYLVSFLCAAAPIVVFSAAIPGQTGHGHVNCQWPAYWADKFEQHGYETGDRLRWRIWDDNRVEPWYRQNLLVAIREEVSYRFMEVFDEQRDEILSVVHPEIWAWKL